MTKFIEVTICNSPVGEYLQLINISKIISISPNLYDVGNALSDINMGEETISVVEPYDELKKMILEA